MNRQQASDLFDRRVRAWLAEDVDAYLACWHDDMRITLPGRDDALVGVAAYRRLVERSFAWAKPVSFDVHALAVVVDTDIALAGAEGLDIRVCERLVALVDGLVIRSS
ncbi:MAG: hypothetical protein QOI55_1407 [Actinomycetota bacterium]|nr:hypothetical protein [Actinomycetota bacterium]